MKRILIPAVAAGLSLTMSAGVVKVGAGSYADEFPGYDKAGRNGYPQSQPMVSGNAAGRPVPTNDWWSNELISNHGANMFNYPLALRPDNTGLTIINPMKGQGVCADTPLTIGLEGLSASQTTVSDYSDWTVTINWGGKLDATIGQGMPFVYFTRNTSDKVRIAVGMGGVSANGNILTVSGSYNGASYAVYAPFGSTWTVNGGVATTDLSGKNYFSAVMFPAGTDDVASAASDWSKYAFVFPRNTRADYSYDEKNATVTTTYTVTTDVKEGTDSKFLMGLLPHHWANLSSNVDFDRRAYRTVRGDLKMAAVNSFSTRLKFKGVLPTLPPVQDALTGFSQTELDRLIDKVISDHGLVDWTDSYNDGQLLNRLVQTARVARESGNTEGFNKAFRLVKERVERWLTYKDGDVDFMFYYHTPWTAMLGYPAGHGQDTNINDHHFHWGYLIHAAAFIEQYEPGWGADNKWGGMVNMLVRDAASSDRDDRMFPYLRNFSPYAGHCWANGFATIGLGADQESTSEAMQFNCSLIHWGAATGNKAIRDLGIYLYATEQSAIAEYWFDLHDRNLDDDYTSAVVSRLFSNGYDNQNFWGGGIAGSYGIQIYPVHAGSFYLADDADFAKRYIDAMCAETGILSNENNDNIWYDTWTKFMSMSDPVKGIEFYNKCTRLSNKFGVSQAQTYQWVHAMGRLGCADRTVTADYPLAMAFNNGGVLTYVAQNYGDKAIEVTFSDGHVLTAQPRSLTSECGGIRNAMVRLTVDPETCMVGEKVSIKAVADAGDYTIKSVAIDIDGQQMATSGSSEVSCEFTPSSDGEFIVTAIVETVEGRTFISAPVTLKVQNSADDPNDPEDGIVTVTTDSVVKIWPNPTDTTFNVRMSADGEITVWSATGAQMYRQMAQAVNAVDVDCSGWPAGVYFVRISDGVNTIVERIIKR